MKVAVYARFSSANQNPRSCDDQIAFVTPWIERNGHELVAVYRDDAVSGLEIQGRRGWQALLEAAEASPRPFDLVVCEDLDRWGREFFAFVDGARRLHRVGVALADPGRGVLDLDSTTGRILLAVAGATSAEVSQKISAHTRRGLDARIGRVSKNGGRVPYGYLAQEEYTGRRDSRGRAVRERSYLVIDEETAPIVRRIFVLHVERQLGYKRIALELTREGIVSPRGRSWWAGSAIRSILTNPVYAGHTRRHRFEAIRDPATGARLSRRRPNSAVEILRDTHPAIVTQDLFDRSQARILEDPGKNLQRRARKHPLSGLLRCGGCGGPMSLYNGRAYACRALLSGAECGNRLRLPRWQGEELLRRWLSSRESGAVQSLERAIALLSSRHEEFAEQLQEARRAQRRAAVRLRNVADAVAEYGPGPELAAALGAARSAAGAAQERIRTLEAAQRIQNDDARQLIRRRAIDHWMQPATLAELVERIVLTPDGTMQVLTTAGKLGLLFDAHRNEVATGVTPTGCAPDHPADDILLVELAG